MVTPCTALLETAVVVLGHHADPDLPGEAHPLIDAPATPEFLHLPAYVDPGRAPIPLGKALAGQVVDMTVPTCHDAGFLEQVARYADIRKLKLRQ